MTITDTQTSDIKLNALEYQAFANPMIDSDGDTYKVQSALNFLQHVLSNDSMTLSDPTETFGLAVILDACAAALRRMQDAQP